MSESKETQSRDARLRDEMAAAQRGDAAAYARLLGELLPLVRGFVRARLAGDPALEDVTQEVLLRVHSARHTYRSERPLLPWVRAIARNAVIDCVRRQQRARARSAEGVETDALPAPPQGPARDAALSPRIERALGKLPSAQREAVMLLKIEGLSVIDAATRAGVSPGALKLRAHRGYRMLRDFLGRELL